MSLLVGQWAMASKVRLRLYAVSPSPPPCQLKTFEPYCQALLSSWMLDCIRWLLPKIDACIYFCGKVPIPASDPPQVAFA